MVTYQPNILMVILKHNNISGNIDPSSRNITRDVLGSNFKTLNYTNCSKQEYIISILLSVREYRWIILPLIAFLLQRLETSNGNV